MRVATTRVIVARQPCLGSNNELGLLAMRLFQSSRPVPLPGIKLTTGADFGIGRTFLESPEFIVDNIGIPGGIQGAASRAGAGGRSNADIA